MRLLILLLITLPAALYLYFNPVLPENVVNEVVKNNTYILIGGGLKIGSTGDDVTIVQVALGQDSDIYPSAIISGYYGQLTRQAVENFQKRYGLNPTGEVNNATADKFNNIYGYYNREYYLSLAPSQKTVELRLNKPPATESEEWGKARQISEHTWTMKVGFDSEMATAGEIFEALNTYRRLHGKNTLNWDDRLAAYAYSRAQYFTHIGNLDEHAGFAEYVKSEENVRLLGFWALGENSSFGYRLSGTHLIEWVYAGDKPHDDNQLSSDWTHVGIGVDGYQTNLIFGGHQI